MYASRGLRGRLLFLLCLGLTFFPFANAPSVRFLALFSGSIRVRVSSTHSLDAVDT